MRYNERWSAYVRYDAAPEKRIEADTRLGVIDLLAQHLRDTLPSTTPGHAIQVKLSIGPFEVER
jgi:hypothetical protein